MENNSIKLKKGFTLLELLIVIAILAILMSIIVVTLNPAELLKKSRDTKRIADLSSLRTAVNLYLTDKANVDLDGGDAYACGSNRWYSLSDTATSTRSVLLPAARTAVFKSSGNSRFTTGYGWLPVDLSSISSGSPLSSLPVDPTNATSTTAGNNLYYTYECNATDSTFEINAQMESNFFSNTGSGDVESKDGGDADDLYEVGSDPGLDLMTTSTPYFYEWE